MYIPAPPQIATQNYVNSVVNTSLNHRGTYDASSDLFPQNGGRGSSGEILKGDCWELSEGGLLGNITCYPGDRVIAAIDNPSQQGRDWNIVQSNLFQYPFVEGTAEEPFSEKEELPLIGFTTWKEAEDEDKVIFEQKFLGPDNKHYTLSKTYSNKNSLDYNTQSFESCFKSYYEDLKERLKPTENKEKDYTASQQEANLGLYDNYISKLLLSYF